MALKLMTVEMWKERKRLKKSRKSGLSKRIEYGLTIELQDRLEELLSEADSCMIEISPKVIGEFINILNSKILSMYEYEQVEPTLFIFSTKEITV